MTKLNKNRFVPIIVSVGVVVGILLGSFFANHFSGNRLSIINNSSNKVFDLFHLIDDQYVDSVSIPDLVERAMPQILKELDPHSTYITAAEVEESMQDLKGSFSGIGVQFTIYKDTIRIVRVVKGGPSESVGLQAGDRIVTINGSTYVGDSINNAGAMKRLKGPKGSEARLGIKRAGKPKLLSFSITRGDVPVKTIDAVYMAAPQVGYIRINSFGDTTYSEFLAALAKLQGDGFENLIIDLRGNPGGYMETAIQIANDFLPKNSLIVYTKGRKSARKEYRTDGRGTYQSMPLVVLVDETSASASEILAGAIQDNDRGMIIGRRSFGKGLVQVPIEFPDGSMLRLTTARYYTPSGRCVQKPYKPGDEEEYEADLVLRAEHGEYFSADSIRNTGEKYRTRLGRVVYGGGGIVPDVFIPRDTVGMTSYFKEAYFAGLLYQYGYDFVDRYREQLSKCEDLPALNKFLSRKDVVEDFVRFASKMGLKRRNLMIQRSRKLLKSYITTAIVSDVLDDSDAAEYANQTDEAVQRATKMLQAGEAFPQIPATTAKPSKAQAFAGASPTGHAASLWAWASPVYVGSGQGLPALLPAFSQTPRPAALIPLFPNPENRIFAVCPRKQPFVRL